MAEYQNPAGRLHELLTRFSKVGDGTAVRAWGRVLNVSEQDVPMHLGDVASLVRDVRAAAEATGSDAFDPIPAHLVTLSRSIFPTKEPISTHVSNVVPDPAAMQALKMLSVYLEETAPEGSIPSDEELDELRMSAQDLIEEVTAADLPAEIKRAILQRLIAVLEALEHLDVGGPDAVRRAAESLAISAAVYAEEAGNDQALFTKARMFAHHAWRAVTVATAIAAGALTWEKIIDVPLLEPRQETPQLLPPPASPAPSDPDSNDADDSESQVT